ncbi:MAG: CpsD/CapB family tyrosine-protein kinase [Planctomycetota bacterium]|jgi:capsular exopolysaccharide synthesis family protein
MGRIADALKRAEEERRVSLGTAVAQPRQLPETGDPFVTEDEVAPVIEVPNGEVDAEPISVVEGLSESLVPFHERSSLITEQYRSLRTRLLSQNPNYEHRVIAITSAVPKEGKSVTTLNLGCILAEIRHLRVCVIDGDFRRSSLANMLNQNEGPGLAEVLGGMAEYEDVLRKTPIPNLDFMPAGSTHKRSAAELLTATSAKSIFKRMQREYHYVIVDTPPATTVTDVGIIGQLCNGVIMVVRLHRTDEQAAKRAARLLNANNIPIVGCLLIGRDGPPGRYGYGYGYAYNYYRYYRYYRKGDEG